MRRFFMGRRKPKELPLFEKGELLYMRVVARDDSPPAQREKIRVRNRAFRLGPGRVKELESLFPGCRVERKTWQPDTKTPPAQTVYITLGPGEGKNWWGVLYGDSVWWAATERMGEDVNITFPFLSWVWGLFTGR